MICHKSDDNSIAITVDILKNGGVVIIPTDTVYGFSGVLGDSEFKIRKIKGRDQMTAELLRAIEEATNLEHTTSPRRIMPYLTVVGDTQVNGEPRRYYRNGAGHYYYLKVAECELYKNK